MARSVLRRLSSYPLLTLVFLFLQSSDALWTPRRPTSFGARGAKALKASCALDGSGDASPTTEVSSPRSCSMSTTTTTTTTTAAAAASTTTSKTAATASAIETALSVARGGGGSENAAAAAHYPTGLRLEWAERAAAAGSKGALVGKCLLEVSLAVSFQLLAEIERRRGSFWAESDYVLAGVLTAIIGKAYAAWRTAPTAPVPGSAERDAKREQRLVQKSGGSAGRDIWAGVPSNFFAFGEYSLAQRSLAVAKPVPKLFAVGAASAFVGYGFAAVLSSLRPPGEAPPLPPVPLLGAALYGGLFLMTVSNLSFQLYQGLVEGRIVDPATSALKRRIDDSAFSFLFISNSRASAAVGLLKWLLVALGRSARGVLVSGLAIRGMQVTGLQRRSPGAK